MRRTSAERRHRIKRGLDLPLAGAPRRFIEPGRRVRRVAVSGEDYLGLRPRISVEPGERVVRGQPLFEDRKNPGVLFTSPGSGTVAAIHRGERRRLLSVVVELDEQDGSPDDDAPEVEYESFSAKPPPRLSADRVRALLVESGLWTLLRARPFGRIPSPAAAPSSIFVTAIDTNPLAADPSLVLAADDEAFTAGLEALVRLAGGSPVYLCKRTGDEIPGQNVAEVETHEFSGPHPAGNAGLHIHLLDPADRGREAWHAGYQETAAIGELFLRGRLRLERVVALGGPAVENPRLLRTRLGASLDELLRDELIGEPRVISGSVLSGRRAEGERRGYLGSRHSQITALPEAGERRFLGWASPGWNRFSFSRMFLSRLRRRSGFEMDTDLNGGLRAMVPSGAYDAVVPFDVMPIFLLRALLAGDIERAEQLGCLELEEEDLALCSFVCPSKIDYGSALREMLTRLEKEG